MRRWLHITALVLGLAFAAPVLHAQAPDDARALEGLETGRVAWDITVGDPEKLLTLLQVVEETYDGLVQQGVEPDMVFLFHGPVLKLISTDRTEVPLDQEEAYDKVAEFLKEMQERPGVHMESCSVAARLMGIDNDTILSGIEPVGNTFISQIGYQAKGYAFIPLY